MKKKKTGLAIFFIIWGIPVTLFGALLVILTLSMILDGEDLLATAILVVIFLAITCVLGVLPLIKGIRILQGKEKKKQSVQQATQTMQNMAEQIRQPTLQPAAQTVQPNPSYESVIHETATPLEAGRQILCKDEQFDDGDWPMIKALLKVVLYIVLPIVAMCVGSILVTQSAGGRIQPNTMPSEISFSILSCMRMRAFP